MTKHFHIILWLPLLFAVLFLAFWINIFMNSYVQLEEFILERQVQYATDSAIAEMLEYSSTDTDYMNGDFIVVEPELALNDFSWCMCWNLGYIPTELNCKMVQNDMIRSFVVCAYDGVYSYFNTKSTDTEWTLVQTPKIPYFLTHNGIQYALTLDANKGYQGKMNGSTFKMDAYNNYADRPSTDLQQQAIVDTIADMINYSLARSYGQMNTDIKVRIPATAQHFRNGVNTIKSPTIITVFEGRIKIGYTTPLAEVIGGSSFEEATHAIGYTFTGQVVDGQPLSGKYYATVAWWERHKSLANTLNAAGQVPKYYDTVFDAAKAGYMDISYIE